MSGVGKMPTLGAGKKEKRGGRLALMNSGGVCARGGVRPSRLVKPMVGLGPKMLNY